MGPASVARATRPSHKFRLVLADQRGRPMVPPQRPKLADGSLDLPTVLFDLELDLLPLIERAQSSALDCRHMDKHIVATALRLIK